MKIEHYRTQLFGSAFAIMRIRIQIQHVRSMWIWIQGFDEQKLSNVTAEEKIPFFSSRNCSLFIPRPPWRPSKQEENSSKRTSSTSKHEISSFFFRSAVWIYNTDRSTLLSLQYVPVLHNVFPKIVLCLLSVSIDFLCSRQFANYLDDTYRWKPSLPGLQKARNWTQNGKEYFKFIGCIRSYTEHC